MHGNMLSLGHLADRGTKTELTAAGYALIMPNGIVLAHTTRGRDKLYRLTARAERHNVAEVADAASIAKVGCVDWHAHFGHADIRSILRLCQNGMANTVNCAKAIVAIKTSAGAAARCEACPLSMPYRRRLQPLCVGARHHYQGCRSTPFSITERTLTLHSAAGRKLQVVRSDNGGEFIGRRFTATWWRPSTCSSRRHAKHRAPKPVSSANSRRVSTVSSKPVARGIIRSMDCSTNPDSPRLTQTTASTSAKNEFSVIIISLYVGDLLLFADNLTALTRLQATSSRLTSL